MAAPDVKNKVSPVIIMAGVTAGLLVLFVVAILIFKAGRDNEGSNQNLKDTLFQATELPADFFRQPEPDPEPEPAPAPPPEPEPEPEPAPPAPPKVVEKYRFLTSDDIATSVEPVKESEAERFRRQFNEQRRGSGVLLVEKGRASYSEPAKPDFKNTDEAFQEGVPRDVASFPVNLERTITVDRNIPAILINAIQSDIAGKVVAQVEQNVYGAHGRNVLIPAGSRAVGYYEPLDKVGMERLAISWQRIITPDGININTTDAEMADAMGRSGITGDVDTRNFDRFGMAFLVSTIQALAQSTVPVTSESQRVALETYGRDISLITGKILEEQLDIKPRVSIPAGARILISPVVDIWFKEPVKNVVQAESINR